MADVVIIGGGVIGLSLAYELSGRGARVVVLDRGPLGQEASWAGAGILPPGNVQRARDPLAALRARSVVLYEKWSEQLRDATGIDNGYRRSGGLEVALDDRDLPGLRAAAEEWAAEGIQFEQMEPPAIRDLEPGLSDRVRLAYHLPEMAQVRNPRHLKALAIACASRGVELRAGVAVSGFEREGSCVKAARTVDGRVGGDAFVAASGAWTRALLADAGVTVRVKPIRGQIVLLTTTAPLLRRIVLEGPRYLVPRPDGRVLVGSTEDDAGFDKRPTPGGVQGLLDFAFRLVPSLRDAHFERAWAGLRPASADGLPYLGPAPGLQNLYVAAGHFRSGLQMSPATAVVMAQLILGEKPMVPLEAFRVDRG
jgi:glycine oxidase